MKNLNFVHLFSKYTGAFLFQFQYVSITLTNWFRKNDFIYELRCLCSNQLVKKICQPTDLVLPEQVFFFYQRFVFNIPLMKILFEKSSKVLIVALKEYHNFVWEVVSD